MSQNTRPIKVHNAGFLLDRLAADCAPLQEYRELTQNAIEAIAKRPDKKGEIVWDVDWRLVEAKGLYKLCIIDNGVGMTPQEMQAYINELSHSGSDQSLQGNFGVGAKITAGTRNPLGLTYLSWKEARGANVEFWRDPDKSQYGLKQFQLADGSFAHWRPVDNSVKPRLIDTHGTAVVLFGHAEEENTALPPEAASYGTHWLARYLNTRYFRFPEGVSVKVREFNRSDDAEWPKKEPKKMKDGAFLRPVHGQSHHLTSESEASGMLSLTGATAYWWILKERKERSQKCLWQSTGHVGALYQNELYEMKTGHAGTRTLQQFGVLFGGKRVVIYVEPEKELNVSANTARSTLVANGNPLPWDKWAEEFRSAMPHEIQAMMDELLDGSKVNNHRDAIRDRLKRIEQLYQLTRYKRIENGDVETTGASGGDTEERGGTHSGKGKSGSLGGARGDLYGQLVRLDGDPSVPVRKKMVEPQTKWVFSSHGTREEGEIEDRAARYLPEQHLLLLNGDFRVFTDMIDRWSKTYESVPNAPQKVPDVVREWFEQQAIEAVIGALALSGSETWSEDDVMSALSEEALTTAVMPRWHVDTKIRQILARVLGRSEAASA